MRGCTRELSSERNWELGSEREMNVGFSDRSNGIDGRGEMIQLSLKNVFKSTI